MKTKQEQIEEMKNELLAHTPIIDIPFETFNEVAAAVYNIGYRKANDVIDELVKNIMTDAEPFLSNMSRNLIRMCASKMKKELAVEMRQEVKK